MSQQSHNDNDPEMLDEYDFTEGVRGKYVDRFADGVAVVVIESNGTEGSSESE